MWVDRLRDAPVLNLWPVPDKSDTYIIRYWRIRRIQDAGSGIQTADVNYRFLPCLVAGLAYNIALKVPDLISRIPMLKEVYEESFALASTEDREKTSTYYKPRIGAI
jgi:hypothetical protein